MSDEKIAYVQQNAAGTKWIVVIPARSHAEIIGGDGFENKITAIAAVKLLGFIPYVRDGEVSWVQYKGEDK